MGAETLSLAKGEHERGRSWGIVIRTGARPVGASCSDIEGALADHVPTRPLSEPLMASAFVSWLRSPAGREYFFSMFSFIFLTPNPVLNMPVL
jgi:hypothetical protein